MIFYALCVYSHLQGLEDTVNIALAWGYVGLRVLHSLVQATTNYVPLRFNLFLLGSVLLIGLAGRNVLALFGY